MIINYQGFGHFTQGLNNQDFGMETSRTILILDGCSGARFSEAGTRLFAQLLSRKEEWDKVENFEENVKSVFDDIMEMMKKYYPEQEKLETDFIMENLLFTIIACFKTEKQYIVKLFGDGYVITRNKQGNTSYMRFSYGKCPPYYAYRYCEQTGTEFSKNQFKTFLFDREIFPEVAIATDGIMPIAKGDVRIMDGSLTSQRSVYLDNVVRVNRQNFFDDVTIGVFKGEAQ